VTSLDFTPDGKYLVSASKDGTALVWDVDRFAVASGLAPSPDEKALAGWWDRLGDRDASNAAGAMLCFERHHALTLPFFKARLRPVKELEPGRIAALIRHLDSSKFVVRQQAVRELEKLGELAEPELEAALEGKPPLEVATQVRQLLQQPREPITDTEQLRELRAVEVLEKIGTPEARTLLEGLAKGYPAARLTREAKASLDRWPRR
jgi:hypothetical protein